jgi:hypothetical protein
MAQTRASTPGRVRPAKSPVKRRARTITTYPDPAPFATPVPVTVAGRPIYLTSAQPHRPDIFDYLQLVALVAFLVVVVLALVGPSSLAEAANFVSGKPSFTPEFVPLQYRGPLGWAWALFKSTNGW